MQYKMKQPAIKEFFDRDMINVTGRLPLADLLLQE